MTIIYCDGACKGNPGLAGSGLVVYRNGEKTFMSGAFETKGTNNTAELKALLHSLKIAQRLNEKVLIKTDSNYSINTITKWAYTWKKNGWKKKGGIKNLDLIKEIHNLYDSLHKKITIEYVKGHAGIEGNELADTMANHAIEHKITFWKKIV